MKTTNQSLKIILASASTIRQSMLRQAGLVFISRPSGIDERALIAAAKPQGAQQTSLMLARSKALSLDVERGQIVIGCDQVLAFEHRQLGKAGTMAEARDRLHLLAGKSHELVGGCVLARGGKIVWEHQSRASLHMRALDDVAIDKYLRRAGPGILASVGCYEVEGLGITLMEEIKGDYFSILGLPLLALLKALRALGVWP